MDNYIIFQMFENPRRSRQAKNFTTNVPKILESQFVLRTDIFRNFDVMNYSFKERKTKKYQACFKCICS